MEVQIDYRATFYYDAAVSFAPLILRVIPRADSLARLVDSEVRTDPPSDIQFRKDLFGNGIARCYFPLENHRALEVQAEFRMSISERNPFHFFLEDRATNIAPKLTDKETSALSPYLGTLTSLCESHFLGHIRRDAPTAEGLVNLVQALHSEIAYERRDDGPPRSPEETLHLGKGACRDTALLLDALLRTAGLPSRLASGYLCEFQVDKGERVSEGAMHAWCEVYLPGAGWVGLDATNGVFCDEHYLPCAVGVSPEDIAPVAGSYYGERKIGSRLESGIILTQIA